MGHCDPISGFMIILLKLKYPVLPQDIDAYLSLISFDTYYSFIWQNVKWAQVPMEFVLQFYLISLIEHLVSVGAADEKITGNINHVQLWVKLSKDG